MENEIQINTPSESVIAAYGTASWSRFLPQLVGVGASILGLILVIGFFWLFAGKISLPEQTVFLGVATPHTLYARLSTETRDQLPEPWRLVINGRSRWPVLFGTSRAGTEWEFFAITPRFSLPSHPGLLTKTVRAVSVLSTRLDQPTTSTTTYLSWWTKTLRHPSAQAQFELNPAALTSSFLGNDTIQTILYQDHLQTNLPSAHLKKSDTPLTGDIFLRFDPQTTTTARSALLQSLNLGAGEGTQTLIQPTQLALNYSSSGTISQISFMTEEPMSSSTKVSLLAALGFSKKAVVTLPDGSLLVERRLPNEEELKKESSYTITGGSLELTDTTYRLQKGATSTSSTLPPCGQGVTIGRFSPTALRQLLSALDLRFLPHSTGLQLYEDHDHISVCIE